MGWEGKGFEPRYSVYIISEFFNESFWFLFQIWVYGNSFESSLVAVANPNKEALEHWATENGVSGDFAALCEDPKPKDYILGELKKIAKEKKVNICSSNWASVFSFFFLKYK